MKKKMFYTELSYVFGLIIMAFGAAFAEKSDLGVSMIVAPAYILHLRISQFFPWFSFGVAEYFVQGLLVVLTMLIVRKFRKSYLFSFVTAVLYGTLLDVAMHIIAPLPDGGLAFRILWYVLGILFCTFAVSLFFHTYISPEAYELIVVEISKKYGFDINRVKITYDFLSTALSIVLSFAFFGFGVFEGIKIGTIIGALVNGVLIGCFSKLLEKFFDFKNKFNIEKYFR